MLRQALTRPIFIIALIFFALLLVSLFLLPTINPDMAGRLSYTLFGIITGISLTSVYYRWYHTTKPNQPHATS